MTGKVPRLTSVRMANSGKANSRAVSLMVSAGFSKMRSLLFYINKGCCLAVFGFQRTT
nr:MAG TPA: hypothetical protein [Caudoviricetes sp.]